MLKDWLKPVEQGPKHDKVCSARNGSAATGDWIIENPTFMLWREGKKSDLWIHSKPGSGKSVIFSTIIDKIRSPTCLLAYYYFDFRASETETTAGQFLASIVWQLARGSNHCFRRLLDYHLQNGLKDDPPTYSQFLECLYFMLGDFADVYIAIDALDEFASETWEKEILHIYPLLVFTCFLQVEERMT
ncbi:hypothetical protein GYMLUDRAFT_827491 [Collybiopsis luxurians FD-317 M1]|uniref:Nephrocystin 3-like N-terminal domain-containing protein n=1 Tax=Collybiopsis luxurians FD-317 M1 TaxID=944289 RepID=A0A0D0AZM1_9AGAR|nr:hypothetical protein GYMLUDRAFT_827491 [Collybiopsis luxurians FD-317 M1]